MSAPRFSTRHTVASLLANRGRQTCAMLRVESLDEAAAAEAAGVELLSVPPLLLSDPGFRDAAPGAFVFPGDDYWNIGTTDDTLRWAFDLVRQGADAVYCGGAIQTVRALAAHGIPVCGHVGLVPSKRTWTGGFRAVGKTLDQAKRIWDDIRALEEAGAFAAEIEVVPAPITEVIAKRTSLFLLSMGAGAAGHAQYLFAGDVLGQTEGHVPRHAKIYADFRAEFERLQLMRIQAMEAFAKEVHTRAYPSPDVLVGAERDVVAAFEDWIEKN